MLKARPHLEPARQAWADSLLINEIYVSLQGESSHQGLLCTFVRLTGCHLRCTYCDSAFAFKGGERMTIDAVLQKVKALGATMVEVTGGEPLLQPGVYPLMEGLLKQGHTVLLETSGAIDVRLVPAGVHRIIDLKTPSSGEVDRTDWRVLDALTERDELKFVIGSAEDYAWSKKTIAERRLAATKAGLLFSTVHGKLEPRQLAEWVIEDRLPVRLQLQQHKVLWPPDARGV